MDLDELQEFWNELGSRRPFWAVRSERWKWQPDRFFRTGVEEVTRLMRNIRSLGIEHGLEKALDFGCGIGRMTQPLADYFEEVDGVDISPSMISLAREYNRQGDRCKYYLNERTDLKQFPDESFDFVYSGRTLQHLKPELSRAYLREFLRILRPEGLIVFQLTNERLPGVRSLLRSFAPTLLEAFHGLRSKIGWPWMEMHSMEHGDVLTLLRESGGVVLETAQNLDAAPGYLSRDYYVVRG